MELQQLGWSYKISNRVRERKGGLSGEGAEGHRCRDQRAMVYCGRMEHCGPGLGGGVLW